MTYSAEVLADSPVAYLRLGEASGTTAADASGNANTGTYVASPTLGVAGAISDGDTAASFVAASSQYVSATLTAVGAALGTSTWECWVKSTATADGGLYGTVNAGFTTMFQLRLNRNTGSLSAGSIAIFVRDQAGKQLTGTCNVSGMFDGAWHHLVVQPHGSENVIGVYLDGVAQTLTYTTSSGGLPGNGSSFSFGQSVMFAAVNSGGPAVPATVALDEVAVYSTRLTAARIAAHYAAATASTVSLSRTASESLALSDVAAQTSAFARNASESLALADAASQSLAFARTASESLVLADAATRALQTFIRTATESVALADSAVVSSIRTSATASESLALADAASADVGGNLSRSVSESLVLSDVASATVATSRTASEQIGLTDAASTGAPAAGEARSSALLSFYGR